VVALNYLGGGLKSDDYALVDVKRIQIAFRTCMRESQYMIDFANVFPSVPMESSQMHQQVLVRNSHQPADEYFSEIGWFSTDILRSQLTADSGRVPQCGNTFNSTVPREVCDGFRY
jgi:hypothetical protein